MRVSRPLLPGSRISGSGLGTLSVVFDERSLGQLDRLVTELEVYSPACRGPERQRPGRSGLSRRQERAAFLLARGATQLEAGRAVGRCRRTIGRWTEKPAFQAERARVEGSFVADQSAADQVLVAALGALNSWGRPNWDARVRAALALTGYGPRR